MDAGWSERPGPQPDSPATWSEAGDWDEAALPRRPWAAPGYLMRGAVSLLIGSAGVSKSSLALAFAAALATGERCHGFRPVGVLRTVVFNVEDDAHEQARRLSGVLAGMGKRPADVAGNLMRAGPIGPGTLFQFDPVGGSVVPTPAMTALEADLAAFGADVLIVDPLAELHDAEENNNSAMRGVLAAFRDLARRLNLAVLIVHHGRKGQAVAADPDAGRGASSIVGACRTVLTIVGMTPEEGAAFGLGPDAHRHFFRLDVGKSNYAGTRAAEWFERSVRLLENGDAVAVTTPWTPPRDALGTEAQAAVEAAIRRGSPAGPWSPQLGNTVRSVKHAMTAAGIVTRSGQHAMLMLLLRDGFQALRFRDVRRKLVVGLRSADGLPAADWEDEEAPGLI